LLQDFFLIVMLPIDEEHSMSDLFWLSRSQLQRIEPYFPLAHGVPRVDDQRVISGIIHVIRNGLRWRDAPKEYGPRKTRSCTHRMAANLCCINHPTRRQTETSSHSSDSTAIHFRCFCSVSFSSDFTGNFRRLAAAVLW